MACLEISSLFLSTFMCFTIVCKCDLSVPGENHHRPHITNDNFVTHRDSDERFVINFYSKDCAKCDMYLEDFERVEEALKGIDVQLYDCNSKLVMQGMTIQKLPSLIYFRGGVPTYFEDEPVAEDIIEWVVESHDSFSTELHDDTFEHLTQASTGSTTGDWLVIFCIRAHSDCTLLIGALEHIGMKLQNKVNMAWIDINHNPELKDRFKLKKATEIMYIRHGKKYQYHLPTIDFSNLLAFASGAYQHSRAETIEPPKSPFDKVTEKIADKVKDILSSSQFPLVVAFAVLSIALFLVLLACLLRGKSSPSKKSN